MSEKSDWLSYDDEGNALVKFKRPVVSDGVPLTAIKMREPTVADQRASAKAGGGDDGQEVALFANLCEVAPSVIDAMKASDYKRLQVAYTGFFD